LAEFATLEQSPEAQGVNANCAMRELGTGANIVAAAVHRNQDVDLLAAELRTNKTANRGFLATVTQLEFFNLERVAVAVDPDAHEAGVLDFNGSRVGLNDSGGYIGHGLDLLNRFGFGLRLLLATGGHFLLQEGNDIIR